MIKETQKKLKEAQANDDTDNISILQQKYILHATHNRPNASQLYDCIFENESPVLL